MQDQTQVRISPSTHASWIHIHSELSISTYTLLVCFVLLHEHLLRLHVWVPQFGTIRWYNMTQKREALTFPCTIQWWCSFMLTKSFCAVFRLFYLRKWSNISQPGDIYLLMFPVKWDPYTTQMCQKGSRNFTTVKIVKVEYTRYFDVL